MSSLSLVIKPAETRLREEVKEYLNVLNLNNWKTETFNLKLTRNRRGVFKLTKNGSPVSLSSSVIIKDITFLTSSVDNATDEIQFFLSDTDIGEYETIGDLTGQGGATLTNVGSVKTGQSIQLGLVENTNGNIIQNDTSWLGVNVNGVGIQYGIEKEYNIILTFLTF